MRTDGVSQIKNYNVPPFTRLYTIQADSLIYTIFDHAVPTWDVITMVE